MDAEQIASGGRPPAEPGRPEALGQAELVQADANVVPFPAPEPETVFETVVSAADPTDDVWVELPAAPEPAAKPARSRRSRSKKAAAEPAEALEPAPAAAEPEAVSEPEPEPVAAAAPEPEPVAISPEPEPEAAPVPAVGEILSPPDKPKRGWWRRNA
jgi:ribonuclease E